MIVVIDNVMYLIIDISILILPYFGDICSVVNQLHLWYCINIMLF